MASTDEATLSDFERQALKDRTAELRKQASRKGGSKKEKDLQDVLDTIEALPEPDRRIARMIHEVVTEVAPELDPKTWYGFPAYAKDGKVIVFYQQASKFDSRYGTLGFQDQAMLDDGPMWPASYAIVEVTDAVRSQVRELVQKAVG